MRRRWLQIAAAVVAVLLLRLKWPHVRDAVVAIDHGDVLFADFVHHYYPTVSGPLRHSGPAGGFFYPAAFAVLIAPLGWLSLDGAIVVWGIVQLLCLAWVAFELVREVAPRRPLLAALGTAITVTSVPLLHNLKWGQVSLPILAAAGAGYVAYGRGRFNLAAVLLGVAAGIKGYPLVFLAWFLVRGDLRFVVRAGVACLVTLVVLPAIAMGPAHALFFQRVSTGAVMGAADGVLRDFNSQYAPAVLSRFYAGGWDMAPPVAIAWAKLGSAAMLVAIGALVVVTARTTAPRIGRQRSMIGLVLLASSVPFWLRTSWSHYFVHLPVAQVLLTSLFARRGGRGLLVLLFLVAPSVYLASPLALWNTEGWWYYANAGSLFFANALVLLGLAACIVDEHVRHASLARAEAVVGRGLGASAG